MVTRHVKHTNLVRSAYIRAGGSRKSRGRWTGSMRLRAPLWRLGRRSCVLIAEKQCPASARAADRGGGGGDV